MLVPSDCFFFFFFNDTATTEIYTLSLHDALPISKAFSYASFGLIHELTALASRTTLMRYRSTRSKNEASVDVASGLVSQAPSSVWYSRYSSLRVGASSASSLRLRVRLSRRQRDAYSRHSA